MHARKVNNLLGKLVTVGQICGDSNLGRTTVMRIAKESGSLRKIGRNVRIDRKQFFDFIEREYA